MQALPNHVRLSGRLFKIVMLVMISFAMILVISMPRVFAAYYPVGIKIMANDDSSCEQKAGATIVGNAYAARFFTLETGHITMLKIADNAPPPPPFGTLRSFTVRVIGPDGFTDLTPPFVIQIGDGFGVFKFLPTATRNVVVQANTNFYVVLQRGNSTQDDGGCLDTASSVAFGNSYLNITAPSSTKPITSQSPSLSANFMIQPVLDTAPASFAWGSPAGSGLHDKPLLMDLDGDSQLDPAIFRDGLWFVMRSTRCYDTTGAQSPCTNFPLNNGGPFTFGWGTKGDVPLVGDVTGDGGGPTGCFTNACGTFDDLMVWRNGTWFIQLLDNSGPQPVAGRQIIIPWGTVGDIPLVSPRWSDFDGDNKVDLVVFRPSNGLWYILLSSKNYSLSQPMIIPWGTRGDVPMLADIDFDRKADLVIWRPSTGYWYVLKSSNNYNPSKSLLIPWGTNGDVPMILSAQSLHSADLAVWRPSTGAWYILLGDTGYNPSQSHVILYGTRGDIPLAAPMEPAISGGGGGDNVTSEHGDFDADLWSDLIIWRPSTGYWYVLPSGAQTLAAQYG